MNREIKFRIWTGKSYKQFSSENNRCFHSPCMSNGDGCFLFKQREDYIIQQFTGMFDKSGKEIYEGDILKVRGYRGAVGQIVVRWEETRASDDMGYDVVGFIQWDSPEVIGNIFENPELIK